MSRSSIRRPGFGDSRPSRERTRRGFTLLEVLVAFAILALSLAAILQSFSAGFHGLNRAEGYAAAVMHARSKLAEVGSVLPLESGESQGAFDNGFTWSVAISRRETDPDTSGRLRGTAAYRVEVTVQLDEKRAVSLTSLRLGEEP